MTAAGCTHVAMESTGIYWRPVYNLLEGSFELSLVNRPAREDGAGPQDDVRDSEWLAQLFELGLLRCSLVPAAAQRELRDVVRYRKRADAAGDGLGKGGGRRAERATSFPTNSTDEDDASKHSRVRR